MRGRLECGELTFFSAFSSSARSASAASGRVEPAHHRRGTALAGRPGLRRAARPVPGVAGRQHLQSGGHARRPLPRDRRRAGGAGGPAARAAGAARRRRQLLRRLRAQCRCARRALRRDRRRRGTRHRHGRENDDAKLPRESVLWRVAAAAFVAVALLRLPLPWVLAALVPASYFLHAERRR